MKTNKAKLIAATAATLLTAAPVLAQSASQDEQSQVRAARRAEGVEASRKFEPGEGNPVPAAKPPASTTDRANARQARKTEGQAAAATYRSAEGDPKPNAAAKIPGERRRAERVAKQEETKAANKAGQIPNYGDNYPLE